MALSFGALFAVILIVVSLVRTFGIPLSADRGSYGEARVEALKQLGLIADITKDRLSSWLEERKGDARAIVQAEPLELLTRSLAKTSEHLLTEQADPSRIRAHLSAQRDFQELQRKLDALLRAHKAYEKIMIVEASKGVIVASTQESDIGESVSGSQFFSAALKDITRSLLDFEMRSSAGGPTLVVARALSGVPPSNGALGIVVMYADAGKLFKPLLDVVVDLGKSGEILLVNDHRILLSSRHPVPRGNVATAGKPRVEEEFPRLDGASQEELLDFKDYRGEKVLVAYRSVQLSPSHQVGIVVKRDAAEVLGPLNSRVVAASLISLLGIVCAAGMAVWIAGWIAGPVDRLTRAAKEIASGNLDVRVEETAPGELGNLAATFDSMVDRIRNWHEELEKQVEERTLALTAEIAERERVEQSLRKSEERFELAVKGTNDGIWDWLDIRGNAAWFSPRFSEMLGWPEGALIGTFSEFAGLAHPDDTDKWEPALRAHFENNVPYDLELRLRTRSGDYRWFRIRGEVIRDATGAPVRMAGSLQDITEKKIAEVEREELIAELETKNAELERFTYTVSHDLSSPLITIKTFVGFVKDDLSRGETGTVAEDLGRVNAAAEKMSVLLDQLLELSRIGRVVNPSTQVDLNELVEEVVELLAALIAERNVQVEIAPDLPTVFGDRARLMEVFQNLIENGVKFMGDQPSPRIKIGAGVRDGIPFAYVQDNGLGIDLAYQEKIFGLFDKLDDSVAGTGIGLALVKRIVEVHGGRIWVESQGNGSGSTFCFTLGEQSVQVQSATRGNHEG